MLYDQIQPTFDARAAADEVYAAGIPTDNSLKLSGFADIDQDWVDDAVLRAHCAEAVWADSTLVETKPDIWHLAAAFESRAMEQITLVADDSLVVVKGSFIQAVVSIGTIPAEERILYQISIHCLTMSNATLSLCRAFQAFSDRYGIAGYADARLIDKYQIKPNGNGFEAYISDPARQRAVFIHPRTTRLPTHLKNYHNHLAILHSAFGISVKSDALYRKYSAIAPSDDACMVVALPGGEIVPYGKDGYEGFTEFLLLLERTANVNVISDLDCAHHIQRFAIAARKPARHHLPPLAELDAIAARHRAWWEGLLKEFAEEREEARKALSESEPQLEPEIEPAPVLAPRKIPLDSEGYPKKTSDVVEWAERKFSGELVILSRARKAMSKVRHPDPARIAKALEALALTKMPCMRGNRDSIERYEEALVNLRMRDTFSNAERLKGQTGDAYVIQHDGRRMLLERHLCSSSSGMNDPKMIRIYYCYDRPSDRIVIGWMPTHLPNTKS